MSPVIVVGMFFSAKLSCYLIILPPHIILLSFVHVSDKRFITVVKKPISKKRTRTHDFWIHYQFLRHFFHNLRIIVCVALDEDEPQFKMGNEVLLCNYYYA